MIAEGTAARTEALGKNGSGSAGPAIPMKPTAKAWADVGESVKKRNAAEMAPAERQATHARPAFLIFATR